MSYVVEHAGDEIVFLWKQEGVGIGFDLLREDREGLTGEIHVKALTAKGWSHDNEHLHWAKLNLSSTQARTTLVKLLHGRNNEIDWGAKLEIACERTRREWRRGEPVVDLATVVARPQLYLLDNIAPVGETSVFYGDGACVAAGTMIEGPDGPRAVEVLEAAGKPVRVWALGEHGPTAAWASAPFIEGVDDLYRFDLEDGRSVTVTGRHRFLTPVGWQRARALSVGDALAVASRGARDSWGDSPPPGYAPDHRLTSSAAYLRASWLGAPRSTGTTQGWPGRCFPDHRLGGEPSHSAEGGGQASSPSLGGVRGHSQRGWLLDGRAVSGTRSPSGRCGAHPSNSRSYQAESFGADAVSSGASWHARRRSSSTPTHAPSHPSTTLPLPTLGVGLSVGPGAGALWLGSSPFALPRSESLVYSSIHAVTKIGRALFYDLQVPGPENYLANGIWHHNSCKSLLSLAAGLAATTGQRIGPFSPTNQVPVMTLDWETTEEEQAERLDRLCNGVGLDRPTFHYRPFYRTLADEARIIRQEVERLGVGLVIVDSIAPACGGEVTAEVAIPFFNALRSFGRNVSRIVVSHVSNATATQEKGPGRPFGSVFVRNLSRSAWEIQRSVETDDESSVVVGMYHRKVNRGRLQKDIGVRVGFDDPSGPIRLARTDLMEHAELADHASIGERIRHALRRGSMDTEALAEAVDAKPASVARIARNLVGVQNLGTGGRVGRGAVTTWALVTDLKEASGW